MILPIYTYGAPILREETVPVERRTPELDQLIADMIETMRGADGIGLAAPQVGRRERLFVVDLSAVIERDELDPDTLPEQPMVFINPEITWESEEDEGFEEGCLSIPDLRETVYRPEAIGLRYQDADLVEHELELDGMMARVVQHEYDHLEGILFVDHLTAFKRRMLRRRLARMAEGEVEADYPLAELQGDPGD
jgi:peptide deformylase